MNGVRVRQVGEQQTWLGVVENRQQPFELLRLGGLGRIHRYGRNAGMQTGEKRDRVVESRRQQQHGPVAWRGVATQCGGEFTGAGVEFAIGQRALVAFAVGEKADGDLPRLPFEVPGERVEQGRWRLRYRRMCAR
ncbi:hypothetical protein R69746_04098 [Paraburkholderia aspalathi]|nr:hypothetical protein R69746_04098 [Paraburkholderia aspalathi]